MIIQTTKPNQQVPRPKHWSYSVILTSLLLCASLLSACAQQDSDRSEMANQGGEDLWPGVTCPITKLPTDTITAESEQFEVCEPEVWGAAKSVVQVKHLYLSSQPDAESFDIAHKKGVSVVINLRDPAESQWDEKKAAEQAKLDYYNVPISGQGQSFDPEAIKQISALVQQHRDQKILLHCSSGNRASAWLAIHLSQDHDFDIEEAISLAKQTGLTSKVIETRVKHYLQEQTQH